KGMTKEKSRRARQMKRCAIRRNNMRLRQVEFIVLSGSGNVKASSGRRLAPVGRAVRRPTSAQRPIQLDDRNQVEPVRRGQCQLRLKEIALRNQHVEIVRHTALVAEIGQIQSGSERSHLLSLRFPLLASRLDRDEGVFHLAKGDED